MRSHIWDKVEKQGQNSQGWVICQEGTWGLSFTFDKTEIGLLYSWRQGEFHSPEDSHAWLQVGDKEGGDPSSFF